MNDTQSLARAATADAILQHPLIAEALAYWESEITRAWKNSNPSDAAGQQELRYKLEAHRLFTGYLQQAIATGRLTRPIPTRMDRAKRVIGLR